VKTPTASITGTGLEKSKDIRPPETMTTLAWRRFRRHPGALVGSVVLLVIILSVTFAFLSPYGPLESDIKNRYQAPSLEHPFGTDGLGRDVLTRCLYGGRVSLFVGFMVMVITLVIGVPVGAIAGFFGGWIDNILMRIIDAVLSLPSLLILILLSAILRSIELPFVESNSVMTISVVIGILSWPTVARLVRAVFLTFREMEYAIMEESGLSFLGFGIMPPTPSWGNLLNAAQEHLVEYPWLAIFPGLMIFFTIISINYIGDGLRDALDPYKVFAKIEE